ncbi:MAG: DNA primase [Desulfotomaculaceae bacterium]|nr:DNA primase [Desulfotomaculaceae bacterium]
MGLIPEDIVEAVRQRSDIVEVVSRYVQLKKKGKNHTGSCPFHSERTPSFTVTPEKQIFYCFGCGTGGDVFKFLMLKDNLSFQEAVAVLAQQVGVTIPADESPAQQDKERRLSLIREVNKLARDYFRQTLQQHGAAANARKYLARREVTLELQEEFQLGFALSEWNSLLGFLESKGFTPKQAAEAGLVVKTEAGRYYDRFRNRLIFPIWDATGQITGFGGRVLDDYLPKYLNTPETLFFSKGRILYGLHLARAAIREKGHVVVMEGYMDVVTAHQHGIKNAVASMGTALTQEHGRLLTHYSRDVVIAYDADAAGEAATVRSLDLLEELGCQVRVLRLPDGKDPDEFLKKHGSQTWETLVTGAPLLFQYKLDQAAGASPLRTPADKLEVLRRVYPSLAGFSSDVEREEGLRAAARTLNLSWETVYGEFKRLKLVTGQKWTNTDNLAKNMHTIVSKVDTSDARSKAEEVLLRLALEEPYLARTVHEKMGGDHFQDPRYQKIFKYCLEIAGRPQYQPAEIAQYLDDGEQALLGMLLTKEIPGDDPVEILYSHIESIVRYQRQERREKILKEIGEAEKLGSHYHLLRELMLLQGIDEAEKVGDHAHARKLQEDYQKLIESNTGKCPKEGSDGM